MADDLPRLGPLPFKYVLSLLVGLALAGTSTRMFLFPSSTVQPSFINCFNYIEPMKEQAVFWAALILSIAIVILSVLRKRSVSVFIEATIIWVVAYLALVGTSSAPYANTTAGVAQTLVVIGATAVTPLVFVRWLVLTDDP